MAIIKPFRGWRYNLEKFPTIFDKLSPLFDVASKSQIEELYQIPFNSIVLSLPRSHDEAVKTLYEWKKEKILVQEALPAIYPYSQKFNLKNGDEFYTRKGFIAMVKMNLSNESPSIILHEQTIPSSVQDRVNLLSKTLLNVSPTHGFYDDPTFELENVLQPFFKKPFLRYIDYQNVINKFNIVQHRNIIEKIQDFLKSQTIILADGHHRLASSQQLRNQILQQNPHLDPDHMVHYHMMYLTNIRGSDVKILPTHRIFEWDSSINFEEFNKNIKKFFNIIKVNDKHQIPKEIEGSKYCYGLIHKNFQWILVLKPEFHNIQKLPLDLPDSVKKLDYTLLHYYLIDQVLKLPYKEQSNSPNLFYTKELETVFQVTNEEHKLGIIVNEVKVEDMLKVCHSGALMPQKSTFFYPKVITGFVFSSIREDENNSPFDISFKITEKERTF